MKIRKVIIPVAGNATRMFPETLGISKTMLPIGKKPAIQYILEECREAGIEEVILVMNYWVAIFWIMALIIRLILQKIDWIRFFKDVVDLNF